MQSNPQLSLANGRYWLEECRKNHPQCHHFASSNTFPSKVIEIGEERIRVLNNPEGAASGFATLTWSSGRSGPMLLLLSRKFSETVDGLRFDDLPYTIRDVVCVAKAFGIHYIWIDALCRVQGQLDDRQREFQKLPGYFTNADLNIVVGVKDAQTQVLCPRLPPRFQPICLNGTEDVFIGWLGTDAYNDPQGLRVSQYPDAGKYSSFACMDSAGNGTSML